MKKIQYFFATTLALISSAAALHAQPIAVSVNFNGVDGSGIDNTQPNSLINSVMDPSGATIETAGAPGFATTNWNNIDRWGDVTSGIHDYTGADSGLHLMWDAPSCALSGAYANLGTSDSKLMDGMDEMDWGGGNSPGPVTAGSVYSAQGSQKPLVYVGGIQAWLAAKGAGSYSVVLYVQGWHGWYGSSEHFIQSVTSGNPSSYNMVPGPVLTPHMFSKDTGAFNGTYSQIASTCTNIANASSGGNYIVFNSLTNDAILLVTEEPNGDWQGGKLMGFQIVATPPTPITTAPTFSLNPAYAQSPVTVTEVAASQTAMTYQWQTNDGVNYFNLPGATASTLVVNPPDQGATYTINYDCVVANSFGAVTSLTSVLTVNAASAPLLTRDTTPLNLYAYVGSTVSFEAAFDGTQLITNRWQVNKGSGFNGLGVTATTNRTLALVNVQLADAGSYQLVATNILGNSNSTPATLTVQADPAAPTLSQPYAYDVVSKSPTAYWRLNEAVDPTAATYQAYDASGHGLNAIYGSGVTKAGIVGPQAPAFVGFESDNGAAGFAQGTANGTLTVPPLNLSSANVTFTAWIHPTAPSPANGGLLVNSSPLSVAGLGFGGNLDSNTGQAELGYLWNNSASARNFHSGLFAPLNTWSFVALAVTPTNATLYLCVFDGTSTNVSRVVNTAANSIETFSTGTTWLGGKPTDNNSIFNGSIDEVAVFDSALSDDQVLNLYFTAQGGGVKPNITQQPAPSAINTFAGQTVTLSAYGVGYPAPSFQWQGGTGGSFHNLANDSHISGANSGALSIKTTVADALDYRLVAANANGSATSSVATVSLTPIPLNGIWTVNYAIISQAPGAPTTAYSGPGVLGNGTFWNALTGGNFANTTTLCDDGVTPSGINFKCVDYIGSWLISSTGGSALLDPYANRYVGGGVAAPSTFLFTNVPNGTYNLTAYAINGAGGTSGTSGTTFTINGVSQSLLNLQDKFFTYGDNTVLFANVVVSDGGLVLGVDTNPSGGPEWDFNGIQLQAVNLAPVTITTTVNGGVSTLSWANYGTLVGATNLTGPWVVETGAVSPFQVNPTNAAKFFRVLVH